MDLEKGDQLVSVRMARKGEEVMLFTSKGISIRFPVSQVPVRSRTAGGVRGIRLTENDSCVAMEVVRPSDLLLLITRQGIGKVVGVSAHRLQNRGGKGVLTTKINNKSGPVADVKVVSQDYDEDVVLVSAKGQVSRTSITEIRQLGRYATGVKIWKPEGDDHVASIACMQRSQRNGHAPTGIMEGVQP
jgi:DNA gyrase subunit A